jgi:hypothetical protein
MSTKAHRAHLRQQVFIRSGGQEDELIKKISEESDMNRLNCSRAAGLRKQEGTTLIVAMVLLLLASLLAVFAMNVGLLAQRTSGADLRSRVVHETLEAALSQGIEYIKNNESTLVTTMLTIR